MHNEDIEYKNWYTGIFSINYLFQGFNVSIFAVVVPIYLLILLLSAGVTISASDIAMIASIVLLPWAIKLFFGMLSDKFGIKNIGRRRPWILLPMIAVGIMWIIIPAIINPYNAIMLFLIIGSIINGGVAISDTAIDGLMMDICPKEQLGRAQGTCWGFRSVGQIIGGPLLAYLIVSLNVSVETIFIGFGFFMMIISFSIIIVKEPLDYPEVNIGKHFKKMLNKTDFKVYLFSLSNALIDGVATVFLSLYILIKMNILTSKAASLDLETTDVGIYVIQANVNLVISLGIVVGAIVGGIFSDKIQRRLSVYLAYILATISLCLMAVPQEILMYYIIAILIGAGMGWRHSSYSAVAGSMSKRHPEMDSTYLSLCNSFANAGSSVGLALTSLLLAGIGNFEMIFIILGLIQNIGIIPFIFINPKDFEIERDLKKTPMDILKPEP
ncbi:MAG: MFS transporter [Promethearchaeota archaeon]